MQPHTLDSGRYILQGRLHAGRASSVWQAHDSTLERDVAIKLWDAATPSAHEAAWLEATIAASITHPHVVRTFDLGVTGDWVYQVMELLNGTNVQTLLHDYGPCSTRDTVALASEVAGALRAVHEAGAVHGDVEPANVVLHAGRARLIDFGSATPGGTRGNHVRATTNCHRATPSSDVHDLGRLMQVMLGDPAHPHGSQRLDRVLAAMLVPDPECRPTMDMVADRLGRLTQSSPASATLP